MVINFKKKLCGPFCGWDSTASRLEPLGGDSLLFTTKFPEIPEGWKTESNLELPSGFEYGTPGLGIQHLSH